MGLTLLLGGARSGKSALAVDLARRSGRAVAVIATAEGRDEEMVERIARHRAARPPDWETIEEPVAVEEALGAAPRDSTVILDCLTLWVSNLIEAGWPDEAVVRSSHGAAGVAARRDAPVIAVTNEVGSGIVPVNELARRFRDLLGEVNRGWADASERAVLIVAGRAVPLSDPELLS
jgi:adenosyl cobinamide kinase/adenosyl cobinamide phosphate guanylyltransferase